MRSALCALPFLLAACGGAPEESPEAARYYERALEAKDAGEQERYLAILRRLVNDHGESKYGRKAALILTVPAYQQEESSGKEGSAAQYKDMREKVRSLGVRQALQQLYDAEVKFFSTPRKGIFEEDLPAHFLAAGPTPSTVPKGRALTPSAPGFDSPDWKALNFSLPGPTRYQFMALTQGEGPSAKLILRALGDLDGDGIFSVYELHAEVDGAGKVSTTGDILVRDEAE
jgi:hypothetical protein